jgi:hypothetical protein
VPIISKFYGFWGARPEVAAAQGFPETPIFCYAAMRNGRRLQAANNHFWREYRAPHGLLCLNFYQHRGQFAFWVRARLKAIVIRMKTRQVS